MNINIDAEDIILYTDRLKLRALRENDLNDFYEYAKVKGIGEAAGRIHHENIDESKYILDILIKGNRTIAIEKDSKMIGTIGLDKFDESLFEDLKEKRGVQLGFVLSKDYHRKGLMEEALRKVIDYSFEALDVDFITAGYFIDNEASKNLQQKLGFKLYKTIYIKTNSGEVKETDQTIMFRK